MYIRYYSELIDFDTHTFLKHTRWCWCVVYIRQNHVSFGHKHLNHFLPWIHHLLTYIYRVHNTFFTWKWIWGLTVNCCVQSTAAEVSTPLFREISLSPRTNRQLRARNFPLRLRHEIYAQISRGGLIMSCWFQSYPLTSLLCTVYASSSCLQLGLSTSAVAWK